MLHEMRLYKQPFDNIKNGLKRIELRLYDEKRSKIQLNDYIIFHLVDNPDESIKVKVVGLLRYNSFEDLFKDVNYNLSGPANSLSEKLDSIHKIYTLEEEKKYGILAICIEKI